MVNPAAPLNLYFLPNGNASTDYGVPAIETFIKAGYVVVATDYQGLGGGGKHQYTVAATNGRDAINAIRAAGDLKEVGAGKNALIYGWSQGGGTTIAAASSDDYINQTGTAFDGIELVGFVAMAPQDIAAAAPQGEITEATSAAMLRGLVSSFSSNVFDFTHFAQNMWATQSAFPEKLKLTDIFTEDGAKLVDEVMMNKCIHVASDTLNYAVGDKFSAMLKATPTNTKAWADAMLAGSVPNAKPVAPVIIYWGTKDTVVPRLWVNSTVNKSAKWAVTSRVYNCRASRTISARLRLQNRCICLGLLIVSPVNLRLMAVSINKSEAGPIWFIRSS